MIYKLLIVLLCFLPFSSISIAFDLNNMTNADRETLQEEIRRYILENPDIIFEAADLVRKREAALENQEDKDLIDFSLSRKVLLCSPITLYAVLSLIRQAVSNFAMEQKAGEMQDLVSVFRKQWEQFTEKIHSMGKSITALTNHYDDLKGPRYRALEKPMDKINELQLGQDLKNKKLED